MQKKRRKSELKMCSPQIVLEKIVEIVIQTPGRHLGYLFHYKQNMKNLEVEMNKLQERINTIVGQIDEAKTSGEHIKDNVSDWLNEADWQRQRVETFMDEKTVKEMVQCFKFSCPDFISRYRLSKEAEKKMGDVKCLSQKANFYNISCLAPPPPELQFPFSKEYVSFDSRALVFNKIMEALTDSKSNVIGIYGTGGVGKTTMVVKVGEQVKKDGLFDEVVMSAVSQDAQVVKIQGVLADRLNLKLEGETEVGRAIELWNRLNNGKRNLVILDDIWKKLNLKEIGIPITDGNKGCKVVLTSRNRHVLKNMRVDNDFPIEVLSELEGWNLFKKINDVDSQLQDIAYAVCRECRGLPAAILAVGAALKGKSMSAWKSSLDKFKKSIMNKIEDIDPHLFTSLRLSYDFLESMDAKSCFLLCCLFPEDAQVSIDELVRHCMVRRLLGQNPNTLGEARDIVCSVVNTLKSSCLLSDGKNDDFVKMHGFVRYVAISIAREEEAFLVKHGVKEWPEMGTYENYTAISLRSETIHELPDELVCPELHTLILECSSSKFQPELIKEISDGFFRGAEKLVVLELNKVTLLPLPSSLGKLKELRMLCLIDCKLGDIAILKYLKNKLEVLSFRGSDIKVLPTEVGELTRLRLLDLGDCDKLEVIPYGVISKLYQLEELHFPHSFGNWEATTANEEISKVSLDEIMSLTQLSTLDIRLPHPRLLPIDLGFLNLIRFGITVGNQSYLYGKGYSSTVVMHLSGIDIDDDFNILERLLGKPGRGGLYPSRSFNNLTQQEIRDCRLKYLFSPSCARGLLQLQRLVIDGSEIMEAVIGNEGEKDEEIIANVINFSQLKTLKLRGLPRLIGFYPQIKKATKTESHSFAPAQSLFNEKVAFPALEKLYIDSVQNITEIWDKNLPSAESFCLLRSLKIRNCEKLINVVPSHMLPQLKSIETLEIFGCPEMEVIVAFEKREEETQEASNKDMVIVQFPQLRILRLDNLGRLSSFNNTSTITETRPLFNYQVAFPALEELFISSVLNITEIWDKNLLQPEFFCLSRSLEIRGVEKLKSLKVMGCEKLMNVVPSHMLPLLKSIETLEVSECPEMEVIVVLEKREEETQEATNKDMIIVLPILRSLELLNLENLKGICAFKSNDRLCFNVQVAFPALEELFISSMPSITEIWDKNLLQPESFSLSRSLGIRGCEKLRSLKVKGCEKLMNVVPSHMLPQLKSIKTLEVFNCPEMEVIVVLEKKEKETQEATNKDIIVFPELTSLTLGGLENLKGVCEYKFEDRLCFNVQVTFPALEKLELEGCASLRYIFHPYMVRDLENLQELVVKNCLKMEAVIIKEEEVQDGQQRKTDKTLFPCLSKLELRRLPELRMFCHFTRPLELPLLSKMAICDCPNIDSFSLGPVSTPNLSLTGFSRNG